MRILSKEDQIAWVLAMTLKQFPEGSYCILVHRQSSKGAPFMAEKLEKNHLLELAERVDNLRRYL
jgi:hypothetical protein